MPGRQAVSYDDDATPAPPPDLAANEKLQEYGADVGRRIMAAVGRYQNNSPRTLQSTMRQLGMSEVGGCREYIRASVAGDKKDPPKDVSWPAFVGTAVGDFVEAAAKAELGAQTQTTVLVKLKVGDQAIQVQGHTDIVDGDLIDLKTRDGIEEVKRDGPKMKECIQVSGYLMALVGTGELGPDAVAILVYLDRSGRTSETWTFTIDQRQARDYLKHVEDRLADVATALASGVSQSYLRDEPESWCWHVKCPFYTACWPEEAYNATEKLTDPQIIQAIQNYDFGRVLKKRGDDLQRAAKALLNPSPEKQVTGVTPPVEVYENGFNVKRRLSLKFTLRSGSFGEAIDVRRLNTISSTDD